MFVIFLQKIAQIKANLFHCSFIFATTSVCSFDKNPDCDIAEKGSTLLLCSSINERLRLFRHLTHIKSHFNFSSL